MQIFLCEMKFIPHFIQIHLNIPLIVIKKKVKATSIYFVKKINNMFGFQNKVFVLEASNAFFRIV